MGYPPLPQEPVVNGETGHLSDHDLIEQWLAVLGAAVPYPPGGATEFLRADGTWDVPPGSIDTTASDIQPAPGARAAGSVGKAADAGHVHGQPADFAPTGLTGATSASRYVGATASGSPGSGTFAVGDYVIAQNGHVWVCTTAGSPGTWTDAGTAGGISIDGTTGDIQASPGTAAAGSKGEAADAEHVHPQPPMFAPTGLTGATAASRYVGATTSGAPGSGTFAKGDFVIDQTASVWVCTTAGSPGTWTQITAGGGVTIDTTTGDIAASPGTAAAGSVGKAADAGHVHPEPATFNPTGATGATAATKYAGATSSGAPASGTHAVGDFVIDQTGTIWICTTAGTPGTWTQVIAGSLSGAPLPLSVANGGTGDNSLTPYALLAGGATSTGAVQSLAGPGTSGQQLVSNGASALPTFQSYSVPLSGGTMTGWLAPAVVALTDAATIAVDADDGNDFRVTLGGNRTLGTPSNPTDGQRIIFQVSQPASGGPYTLGFTSAYEFSTSLVSPTLSTGASVTDLLGFIYNAAKSKWLFVAFVSGFS